MSPTLVLPPPFRRRELPPYGHADWKRVQPILLRRSLALSSAAALTAGLALGLVIHRVAEIPVAPEPKIILPPIPPPDPGYQPPKEPKVKVTPDQGLIVAKQHDEDSLVVEPVAPVNPGPFDPNATSAVGTVGSTSPTTSTAPQYPARPDPEQFVVWDEAPKEVYSPKPDYPELPRQAQMEGTVVLKALVSREGRVEEVILLKSSPMFDDAAEKAIRQWRFRPAIMGHEPVAAWVTIPVRFVLNE